MPTYIIQCADRKTAKPYNIRITAESPQAATDEAVAQGHMVGGKPILEHADAPPPISADAEAARHEELERDLRRVTGEVIALRQDLASLRQVGIIRAPVGTIATGIVVGLIAWSILLFLFWLALAGALTAAVRH